MANMKKNEKNGVNRCPHCGASDVKLDVKSGKLKCKYCRSLFEEAAANAHGGVENLNGDDIGSGAANIVPDEKVIVTLKCPSCGAEVVINTDEAVSARCHWCRHTLSLNEKMPNGAVPDFVLPFKTEKGVAEENIRAFVRERQFFAHPKFRKEFSPENVMGVYLPYMIVDVNAHAEMTGEAEHLIRRYTVGSGNNRRTYYDAEAFKVSRKFDLLVDDLTIEASSERLQQDVRANTNNVINAIMPFDTENCVDWNPNFLHGFASERRDTNVDQLRNQLDLQVGDIARYKVKESMDYYDRGAKWASENVTTKGTKWKAAYLPVWLYSYLQDDGKKKMLHYVAVNARTGETMGSVPINKTRLMMVSIILEILGIITGYFWIRFWLSTDVDDDNPFWVGLAGLTPGFIFYWVKAARYRNMNARHKHEAETLAEIKNLEKTDESIGRRNRLRNSRIEGENDSIVKGVVAKAGEKMMGEKMANWIGIGRMAGSTPKQTAAGQASEKQGKRIASIVIIVTTLVLISIIVLVIGIAVGNSRKKGSKGNVSASSTFVDMKAAAESWSGKHNAEYRNAALRMAVYDKNSEDGYKMLSSDSKTPGAFSLAVSNSDKYTLSQNRFTSTNGKALENIVKNAGLKQKSIDTYLTTDDEKTTMALYVLKDSSGDSYIVCDLRETDAKRSAESYLSCMDIEASVLKSKNIKVE